MMVLVDTSVWIDFFNGHSSAEARTLAALIEDEVEICTCGVVVAEFFQGLRQARVITKLERYFRELCMLSPATPETYLAAAAVFRKLRERGVTVRSTIDCLVACLAEAHGALLLAKDRDMRQIVDSGLLRVRHVALIAS